MGSADTTAVIVVDRDAPDPAALAEAAAILQRGGLVAFATETVYGLGADATSTAAVERIFAAKGRPCTNPLIVHACDVDMARRYARSWPEAAQRLARAFWPGPLTLVLPKTDEIPATVTAGLPTVGLRVPAPSVARSLIEATGRPLAAPSANRSEHVSPTTATHVMADLGGRIDLVLDSGPTEVGIESTVVDLSGPQNRVLRPGPIDFEQLVAVLGRDLEAPATRFTEGAVPASSPGQHHRHYAPKTPAVRVSPEQSRRLSSSSADGWLVVGRRPNDVAIPSYSHRVDLPTPEVAARDLYATLRTLDTLAIERIVVVMPPADPQWAAVADRLMRATKPAH